MRLTGKALRLTVLVDDTDTWHHKPLFTEIVHRAHLAGLAGASVFRGWRVSVHHPRSTPRGC